MAPVHRTLTARQRPALRHVNVPPLQRQLLLNQQQTTRKLHCARQQQTTRGLKVCSYGRQHVWHVYLDVHKHVEAGYSSGSDGDKATMAVVDKKVRLEGGMEKFAVSDERQERLHNAEVSVPHLRLCLIGGVLMPTTDRQLTYEDLLSV